MPLNTLAEEREQFFQEGPIVSNGQIAIQSMEHPERGINGIIDWRFAAIGEAVGDQAVVHKRGERLEQAARLAVTTGEQEQTGQRDHSIAAPIGEPGITSNDGLTIRREA